MGFENIRLITFDCYGTLIDWESGMLAAMRPLFSRGGNPVPDSELLEHYGEAEAALEAGPYLPYREVLTRSLQEVGRRAGVEISRQQGEAFAGTLTRWEPFPDTVRALQSLGKRFTLGIISNIDDDLFSETRKKLGVEFPLVVTAQLAGSYKPSHRNFELALERSGLSRDQMLHAGQSLYHDIAPANALGFQSIWVDRPSARPGAGATRPGTAKPAYKVSSLAELVELVC